MGRFSNKTIIITGGARGIGYGIATAFAKEGANLVLTSIVQEELNNAKQTLEEEYGVKVLALYADGGVILKYRPQLKILLIHLENRCFN